MRTTAGEVVDGRETGLVSYYGTAIALGAFLLFAVEPLIARYILPWFGGGIEVWTTCMLFFQIMLVLGYLYAHLVTRHLRPRSQLALHGVVLLAAVAFLPVVPAEHWKPAGVETPALHILLLLLATTGLPFFALAATSPLLQRWISTLEPDRNVYRLYALSNAGSLLALVTYPFLVEPYFSLHTQSWAWSVGLIVFVLAAGLCGWPVWRSDRGPSEPTPRIMHDSKGARARGEGASRRRASAGPSGAKAAAGDRSSRYLWLLLPAAASMMLLGSTNMICLEVASFPFLWVLPLTLYLLTFVICFASERWYSRRIFLTLAVIAGFGVAALRYEWVRAIPIALQVVVYMVAMFACCMVCHGETYRLRPPAAELTSFYLFVSCGGALGGFVVAIVAPLVFRGYWELYIAMSLCIALGTAAMRPAAKRQARGWRLAKMFGGGAVLCAGAVMVAIDGGSAASGRTLARSRNFYGVLRVQQTETSPFPRWPELEFTLRELLNGRISHGGQIFDAKLNPERARRAGASDVLTVAPSVEKVRAIPTTYYGADSGGGIAMQFHPGGTDVPRRIGIIGLGAGTLALYGQSGDTIRYFEINPDVATVAGRYFTFLSDCQRRGVNLKIVFGDGRLSLQKEPPKSLDILVVDAFNGDAIPVHLLTEEAFSLYLTRLRDDGVLAIHVSNRHLSLASEVARIAAHLGVPEVLVHHHPDAKEQALLETEWVLLSRNRSFLDSPAVKPYFVGTPTALPAGQPWTDDFSSLFRVVRW